MMVKENLVRDGEEGKRDCDLQQCFVLHSWEVAESFPSDSTMYRCYPINLYGCSALLPNRRLQLSGGARLTANLQFHLPLSNLP